MQTAAGDLLLIDAQAQVDLLQAGDVLFTPHPRPVPAQLRVDVRPLVQTAGCRLSIKKGLDLDEASNWPFSNRVGSR